MERFIFIVRMVLQWHEKYETWSPEFNIKYSKNKSAAYATNNASMFAVKAFGKRVKWLSKAATKCTKCK